MDEMLKASASNAINRHVTARNWIAGCYIVNYEQNGADRAAYGTGLLRQLSERLGNKRGYSYTDLKLYRQFYLEYRTLPPVVEFLHALYPKGQSVIGELESHAVAKIGQSPIDLSAPTNATMETAIPAATLFSHLSYTHFVQLLPMSDPLERTFYEKESIKGCWSARELKRQIRSGYYQRCALSRDKDALRMLANNGAESATLPSVVKSPFVFEFLGLEAKDVVEESDLETALVDHLQEFMLEHGTGFCFEARQKRILIGNEYFYCDLVFYNRIIHSGCIIELKSHPLSYKDVAQLNMYLAYYRKHMMTEGDNPPVGILMCTEAGKEMVEFATAGIDENLFVSKYVLKLPSKEELTAWLKQQVKDLGTL